MSLCGRCTAKKKENITILPSCVSLWPLYCKKERKYDVWDYLGLAADTFDIFQIVPSIFLGDIYQDKGRADWIRGHDFFDCRKINLPDPVS